MMSSLVSAESLSFSWQEGKNILSNLNFQVSKGEFISLVGPNGSGKTTLVRLLLGLLQPSAGKLVWHEKVKIGYVPQFSRLDEYFPITAWQVVLMGKAGKIGFSEFLSPKKEKAEQTLHQVGLWEKRGEPFHRLSGGQKQRILIARALFSQPDILILDESTASLDSESTRTIYKILLSFSKAGKTVFSISHDLNFVSSMTNRVFCLEKSFSIHSTLHYMQSLHFDHHQAEEDERALVCHDFCSNT